jgi:hypothetical protein
MRAQRALLLILAAICACAANAALAQQDEPTGWQNQRTVALQSPGRSMSMLRLLDRNHDMGRHEDDAVVRLSHGLTIRQGRAYLFRGRSDDFPVAQFAATLDGKGVHLIMSWPP